MTEPRWLDEREAAAWRSMIYGFRALIDVLDRELQADSGLPHAYFEILVPLSEHPERRMRMSELAELTHSSRSRLSHAVSRLVERGWVTRVECPTDKRGQLAELTDEGFAVVAAAAPQHVAAVRRYFIDRLDAEQLRVLTDVARMLKETTAGADLPPRPS